MSKLLLVFTIVITLIYFNVTAENKIISDCNCSNLQITPPILNKMSDEDLQTLEDYRSMMVKVLKDFEKFKKEMKEKYK